MEAGCWNVSLFLCIEGFLLNLSWAGVRATSRLVGLACTVVYLGKGFSSRCFGDGWDRPAGRGPGCTMQVWRVGYEAIPVLTKRIHAPYAKCAKRLRTPLSRRLVLLGSHIKQTAQMLLLVSEGISLGTSDIKKAEPLSEDFTWHFRQASSSSRINGAPYTPGIVKS
ncbi:hypothetical protein B0T14DRAFT_105073 [Immersiella caudata]|uniref:Uncharacterized protein n=1 Tax=Immersiella caudata TaxID=314043 RepID=A0AA39X386_9PEZI|nr:hypothetical protein B0T14DRAFT_105073 [Immersiella caudata]